MKIHYSWWVAIVLAVVATTASALPRTFSIQQVYSNADGTVQFIVIYDRGENDCDAGENLWGRPDIGKYGSRPAKNVRVSYQSAILRNLGAPYANRH
jgi:hypothetical protein